MKKVIIGFCLSFCLFLVTNVVNAQQNVWRTLAMVKMEKQFSRDDGMGKSMRFSAPIERLEGQEVTVEGYIVPLSGKKEQSHFMFSAYPFNMCYFCGNAGPETIMETFMKGDKKVAFSETKIKLKGTFRIQSRDMNDIMYRLENAVLIKE